MTPPLRLIPQSPGHTGVLRASGRGNPSPAARQHWPHRPSHTDVGAEGQSAQAAVEAQPGRGAESRHLSGYHAHASEGQARGSVCILSVFAADGLGPSDLCKQEFPRSVKFVQLVGGME